MAWANVSNVVTDNVDSASKNPALAREDLYNALVELQNVINGRGAASGVASLDSTSKVPQNQINPVLTSTSGEITLQPNNTRVNIEDIINLNPVDYSSLPASPSKGDVAYLTTDGGSGSIEQLVFYNGSDWYKVSDPTGSAIPSA